MMIREFAGRLLPRGYGRAFISDHLHLASQNGGSGIIGPKHHHRGWINVEATVLPAFGNAIEAILTNRSVVHSTIIASSPPDVSRTGFSHNT